MTMIKSSNPRFLVCDLETNSVEPHDVTKLHCGVIFDGENYEKFDYNEGAGWLDHLTSRVLELGADYVVGHNFIGYDLNVIRRFCPDRLYTKLRNHPIIDTFVLSQYLNADRGGHSLSYLSKGLEEEKSHHEDWETYTPEMLEYCIQDTKANYKVLMDLLKEGNYV